MAILPGNIHPIRYEISVSGQISPERAECFGDLSLSVRPTSGGQHVTILSGSLADQAALFGVLNRIRDLGLRLVSVSTIAPFSNIPTHPQPNQETS